MIETRSTPDTVATLRQYERRTCVGRGAFLAANSRRGKNPWHRRCLRVFRRARSRRHRVSGGCGYERRRRPWIGENIENGAGVVTHETRFVYDGNQIVLQFDSSSPLPAGEGQGEGFQMTNADLSHRYLWGPAVDQLLSDEQLSPLPLGE